MATVQIRKLQQTVQNHEEELNTVKNDLKTLRENYTSAVNRISELEEKSAIILEERNSVSKNEIKFDRKFSLPGDSLKMKERNLNIRVISKFQFHELLPEFTALENVCMPGWIGNNNSKKVEKKAKELLNQMGLSDRIHHKPQELSGGEQQRVAVARALINDPKVIFADEPSGNLDSNSAASLHEIFFKLRDQTGCTFVIVTHNDELANMADRKILLRDGKIIS